MPNSRRVSIAAAVLASVAAMSACSHTDDPAPAPTPSVSADPTTKPSRTATKLAGPLTAKDLGAGWSDSPAATVGDWVSVCGDGTGVSARQQDVRAQALTAPGGVEVLTRVSSYEGGGGAAAALEGAEDAFNSCPLTEVPGGRQVVGLLTDDVEQGAVGALVSTVTDTGLVTDASGYWIVQVGGSTVEVYANGLFVVDSAQDPMEEFITMMRDAAIAKALGERVPAVSLPLTEAAASSGASSGDTGAIGGTGGEVEADDTSSAGGETGPGVTGGSATDPGAGDIDTPAAPNPGVGGESGPGSVYGQGDSN